MDVILSKQKTLGELLAKDLHYSVPKYQREYSWIDEHIRDFLDDLCEHMCNPIHKYYFFGTFYLISNLKDKNEKEIVDGQQRLTTTLIFLTVVRDMLEESDKHIMAEDVEKYLQFDNDPKMISRLTLNTRNKEFFEQLVLSKELPQIKIETFNSVEEQNVNLAIAYKQIYELLTEKIKDNQNLEGASSYLVKIRMCLLDKFIILENVVENKDIIHEIFDKVNRRGMSLAESDHVKNKILELSEKFEIDIEEINKKWLDLIGRLEEIKIDESRFLRHYLLAYYEHTDTKEVANKIIKLISNEISPLELVDELIRVANIYADLIDFESNNGYSESVKDDLMALKNLKSHAIYPALLIGRDTFEEDSQFAKLINILLIFFFRTRTINKAEAHTIENTVNSICKVLKNNKPTINEIKKILRESSKYPSDETFKLKFSAYDVKGKISRYVLTKLNDKISGSKRLTGRVTIEHIMPKKIIGTDWEKYFKKKLNYTNKAQRDIYHLQNLNKLGNLTLLSLSRNTSAQNESFTNKLKIYKTDNVKITTMLKEYTEWNGDTIRKRQSFFAEKAVEIWKI